MRFLFRLTFFFEKVDIRFYFSRTVLIEHWYFCLHGNAFEEIIGFPLLKVCGSRHLEGRFIGIPSLATTLDSHNTAEVCLQRSETVGQASIP